MSALCIKLINRIKSQSLKRWQILFVYSDCGKYGEEVQRGGQESQSGRSSRSLIEAEAAALRPVADGLWLVCAYRERWGGAHTRPTFTLGDNIILLRLWRSPECWSEPRYPFWNMKNSSKAPRKLKYIIDDTKHKRNCRISCSRQIMFHAKSSYLIQRNFPLRYWAAGIILIRDTSFPSSVLEWRREGNAWRWNSRWKVSREQRWGGRPRWGNIPTGERSAWRWWGLGEGRATAGTGRQEKCWRKVKGSDISKRRLICKGNEWVGKWIMYTQNSIKLIQVMTKTTNYFTCYQQECNNFLRSIK